MHYRIKNTRIRQLIQQRNNVLAILIGLFTLCLIESITIYHLSDNQTTHFTPLPAVVTQPFSISRNHVSNSYIAGIALYFAMLRLNYTPASLPVQASWLLRYTNSDFYGAFKQALSHEIQQAKAHDISVSFAPVSSIEVNQKQQIVWLSGDLTEYVGKVRLPVKRVKYRMTYRYQNGQFSITSMQQIKKGS